MTSDLEQTSWVPVLDGCFHLHTLLVRGTRSLLYAATHECGREALIRVTRDQASFFDSLAAFYAAEGNPHVPRVHYNYPPGVVGGRDLPLDRPVASLWDDGDTEPGNVGALVMDWVEGSALDTSGRDLEPLQKIEDLLELTSALAALADAGVVVGDLRPDNVWVDRERDSLQIVSLGISESEGVMGGSVPPEPADDIYRLGAHFLAPVDRFGRLSRLARRCARKNPSERPDLAEIQRVLKLRRKDLMPKRSLEILVGMLRPLNLAVWGLIVTLGVTLLPTIQSDRPDTLEKRIRVLREDSPLEKRVGELRVLLRQTSNEVERRTLIEDIAAIQEDLPPVDMPETDRRKPLATLSFIDAPMVIGRDRVYRLGDWIRVEDRVGFLTEIRYSGIQISNGEDETDFFFDRPEFFGAYSRPSRESAILFDHENNIARILSVVAEEMGLVFEDRRPVHQQDEGKLVGELEVNTLVGLLEEINPSVALEWSDERLVLLDQGFSIPIYRRFVLYRFEGTVEELANSLLKNDIGCEYLLSGEIASHEISFEWYNVTWQEILDYAGLELSVVKTSDNTKKIVLGPGEPVKGG